MPEPLRRSPESYGPACNASPLMVLARAARLDLLRRLCGSVIVPSAVADEVLHGPADDPAAAALQTKRWLEQRVDPGRDQRLFALFDRRIGGYLGRCHA